MSSIDTSNPSTENILLEPVVLPTKKIIQGWMQHLIKVPKVDTSHEQPNKRSRASVSILAMKRVFGFKTTSP